MYQTTPTVLPCGYALNASPRPSKAFFAHRRTRCPSFSDLSEDLSELVDDEEDEVDDLLEMRENLDFLLKMDECDAVEALVPRRLELKYDFAGFDGSSSKEWDVVSLL